MMLKCPYDVSLPWYWTHIARNEIKKTRRNSIVETVYYILYTAIIKQVMTKNPIINAIVAIAYIAVVALFMNFMSDRVEDSQSFLAPVVFISIFTLSAAIMGYIFLYQPLQLFLSDDKKGGVKLFLQTIGIFAVITIIIIITILIWWDSQTT